MFREMAEKRKRICVLELLFFLRKNYPRIHKEIIVIEKSITIELRKLGTQTNSVAVPINVCDLRVRI